MADTRYLLQRRQAWYFRMPVPRDLREVYGRAELVFSLKTRDLSVAQSERWKHAHEWHDRFKLDRAKLNGTAPVEAPRVVYQRTLEDARQGLHANLLAGAEEDPEASGAEIAVGLMADEIGPEREPTPQQQAALDALHDWHRERQGRKVKAVGKYRAAISEVAEGYMKERQRDPAAAMKNQTEDQERAVFRLFADYCGDKAMAEVTPEDAAKFLDKVATLDRHWGRSPNTKERSFAELLSAYGGKGSGLSGRTLNRYARALAKAWKWAKKRGEVSGDNPFAELSFREAKTSRTGYLAYTPDQLNKLFAVAPESVSRDYARPLLWVPRIALYSGMRSNEICSLEREDIKRQGRVWYFDITEAKSDAGVRVVPIHSKLIAMGLMDMLPESGRLFPELKPGGPDEKLGWYFSKRFTELRRKAGTTAVDPKTGKDRLTFHSLRKNVGKCLEQAKVPQNEAAEIIGHEKEGITYRVYNPDGLTMRQRQAIVEKIKFPGLKLPPR